VTYFQSAYSNWVRTDLRSLRRVLIRYSAEYVRGADCTNREFYAPPFGTAPQPLDYDDADMDDATQRGLDWDRPIHSKRFNNVLFADGHVAPYAKFIGAQMTHDIRRRAVDWGELDPEDPDAEPSPGGR
jgi:prepilin-type processing-associated H-X9-DG protein